MLSAGRRIGPPLPLLWRVFFTNAAMLTAGTLSLALSPATVSFPIALTEVLVLGGGLAATLALDLLLLRRWLAPSKRLASMSPPAAGQFPRASADGDGGGRGAAEDEVRTRLLVCWTRPYHLSEAEAHAWASAELTRLLAASGHGPARLSTLRGASPRYHGPWEWLLELDLTAGHGAVPDIESAAWREWLGDLRLLGVRPVAMVAADGHFVSAKEQ